MPNRGIAATLCCLLATQTWAQDEPLSAIPWLSDSLSGRSYTQEAPASPSAPTPSISVKPLNAPERQATGLISARAAGLPDDLWQGSDPADLTRLIMTMPVLKLPAAQDLFETLVLMEARPPDGGAENVLLARVDALLIRGRLDAAQTLLERAGPDTTALFRRWFDVGLLTGTEDRACATLEAKPELYPNYETRIFCLARSGRWPTAALTLETAAALNAVDSATRERLTRFLDPELFEGVAPLPLPDPITPLEFRILEAVGEPVPSATLPLAFAKSDLRHVVGWKSQIEAAERLARAGSLAQNILLGLYTSRPPAASGGVWDRVALIQALDISLTAGDAEGTARWLGPARKAMNRAGLEMTFARMMAPRLNHLKLPEVAAVSAYELALISNTTAAFAPPPQDALLSPKLTFAAAFATGQRANAGAGTPFEAELRAALDDPAIAPSDARLIEENKLGEALLMALHRLDPDAEADAGDVADALRLIRHVGKPNLARHAVLQILMTSPDA